MKKEIRNLKEKRAKIVADQRKILDTADTEKRELTSDENTAYEQMEKDFEDLDTQIVEAEQRQEVSAERRKNLEERQVMLEGVEKPKTQYAHDEHTEERSDQKKEYADAYDSYLRRGLRGLSDTEYRTLSAGVPIEGGNTVVPEEFISKLITSLDDLVYVRSKATKFTVTSAASLGVPTLDSDPSDADWTSELATGNEDNDMGFGKRNLTPSPVAKRIKVSEKLVRNSAINVDSLVKARLGYKFGITHEKAFYLGTGSNQPLGLFTASANGISAARDIVGSNTATAIVADSLIDTKYSLKAQYHTSAGWLFHRDAVKNIRKLKDGNGDYLWKQGLGDKSDTILELPYSMSEYIPNTFTTGQYVGLLGDLSFYWIVDALNMTIKVLDELYAETNQIGYIGRMESDGMPVLEEAFARVKLG